MSSEIRQRPNTTASMSANEAVAGRATLGSPVMSGSLHAPSMLQASPQQTGYVMKLHVPLLFSLLPLWFQELLMKWSLSISWFQSWFVPQWKKRFLMLLGSYLYRFTSDADPAGDPKGMPIPVESIDVYGINVTDDTNTISYDDQSALLAAKILLPQIADSRVSEPNRFIIVVSDWRKKTYFVVDSIDDGNTWINSVEQARVEAIRRSMGHAPTDSYPAAWNHFDRLGTKLVQSKTRIRDRVQNKSLAELELSNLAEGGPLPRGYYG